MADWDAITHARLIIECPKDGSPLMEKITISGGHVMTQGAETWREEWVGDHDASAVANTPEDDKQHFRYVLNCPDCDYRKVIRGDTMKDVLEPILLGCHATKATYRITDIDSLLRRVARSRAD